MTHNPGDSPFVEVDLTSDGETNSTMSENKNQSRKRRLWNSVQLNIAFKSGVALVGVRWGATGGARLRTVPGGTNNSITKGRVTPNRLSNRSNVISASLSSPFESFFLSSR